MNKRDKKLLDAYERGFALQEEYLGTDKPVNRIEPLVSVCTITYQHAPFIRQCLDSILMQETDFPWEFIIGEDGSTDGTREICIEYAERHPDRIRLFLRDRSLSQYQEGAHTRRFNGRWTRRSARGKYIALCEGDDYWTDPKKLQKQITFLQTHPEYAMSAHNTLRIFEDGTPSCIAILHPKAELELRDFLDIDLFQQRNNLCLPAHTSSYVIRVESLPRPLPLWAFRCSSGDFVVTACAAGFGNCHFINETMSVRRKHDGSITRHTDAIYAYTTWIAAFHGLDERYNYQHHQLISNKVFSLSDKIIELHLRANRSGKAIAFALTSRSILRDFQLIKRFFHWRRILHKKHPDNLIVRAVKKGRRAAGRTRRMITGLFPLRPN